MWNLFGLPKIVSGDVMCKWSELEDLIHLDSAFCNSTERHSLFHLYESSYFSVVSEVTCGAYLLLWANLRHVKLSRIELRFKNYEIEIPLILQADFSKVSSLSVRGTYRTASKERGSADKLPKTSLTAIVNSCSSLKSLTLEYLESVGDILFTKRMNQAILAQLTTFNYCGYRSGKTNVKYLTGVGVRWMSSVCHNLQHIKLGDHCQNILENDIIQLISANFHLRTIEFESVSFTDALVDELTKCADLESLVVEELADTPLVRTIISFIERSFNLKFLSLRHQSTQWRMPSGTLIYRCVRDKKNGIISTKELDTVTLFRNLQQQFEFFNSIPNLIKLSVYVDHADFFTDWPRLLTSPELQILEVSFQEDGLFRLPNIKTILSSHKKLTHLIINGYCDFADISKCLRNENNSISKLTFKMYIPLYMCAKLDWSAIVKFLVANPQIKAISFSESTTDMNALEQMIQFLDANPDYTITVNNDKHPKDVLSKLKSYGDFFCDMPVNNY